jgi:hypothetical protein
VVKKHNVVYVQKPCGLGNSVSEEYILVPFVFSRLSEEGVVCFFTKVSILVYLVSMQRYTISMYFGS